MRRLWKKLRPMTQEEKAERGALVRQAVLRQNPTWTDMPPKVFAPVYVLTNCLVCDEPRYAHHGAAKRHLITYGGEG